MTVKDITPEFLDYMFENGIQETKDLVEDYDFSKRKKKLLDLNKEIFVYYWELYQNETRD